MTYNARTLTDGFVAALTAAGLAVGDGVGPKGVAPPFCVLYPLSGGIVDGPIDDPHGDVESVFQVTSVGVKREQAEWVADKARVAMLAARPTLTGRQVSWVDVDMLGGVQRDDDVQPAVYSVPERFRVWTVPA